MLERLQQLPPVPLPHGPVKRLMSGSIGSLIERYACLRPTVMVSNVVERHMFAQELVSGRVCATCTQRCGVHVFDSIASEHEAAAMVAHGRVLTSRSGAPAHERNFAWLSSSHGGHLLGLRLAERLRRLTARFFDVPLRQLSVTEHFVRRSDSGSVEEAGGYTHTVHCDEAINPRFHFSAVLYLGRHSADFGGGELGFFFNRSWPWLLVEPTVGRAVLYSSGWENIHRVKPVTRGERWAFVAVFAVDQDTAPDPPSTHPSPAQAFAEACVRPATPAAYAGCGQIWKKAMDDTSTLEGAG